MKVLQIIFLTGVLVIGGTILGRVSAQNVSNANVSSNTNRANTVSNQSGRGNTANANAANIISSPGPAYSDEIKYGDDPMPLKVISMQKDVKFRRNGTVKVQIIEEVGQPFTVRFVRDGETVAQFVMRNRSNVREYFNSAVDPKISFRLIEIPGVPSPLVHVVIVQPGGTDYAFFSVIFGEINGKIRLLTPIGTSFRWEGGIQIGNLGPGNGTGLAVWNSIWGDGEPHYGEHYYFVDIYNFDQKLGRFVKTKRLKTTKKCESPEKALESLGLSFYRDAVRDFPEFLEYRENF